MSSRLDIKCHQLEELFAGERSRDQHDTVARPRGTWADGEMHFHQVRPWAAMHWGHGRFDKELRVRDTADGPSMVFMAFALEGAWREEHAGWSGDFGRVGGQMSLIHGPSVKMHSALPSSSSVHLTVAMRQDRLLEQLADDASAGAEKMRRVACGVGRPDITVPLSTAALNAVEQVRRCPLQGLMRTLMLEGRFADLLLDFVHALDGGVEKPRSRLPRADEERIRAAADLLERRMETPPSLTELACEAGLCESKLKRGFQQVFGTTAFGYLKTRRMEQARRLLESGDCSVMEAALSVGYANPSHFANAFRQQFGLNPKKLQLTASGRNHAASGWISAA